MAENSKKGYCMLSKIAFALIVIGALNWLLVGIFQWDLVAWIFGKVMVLGRIVYILIGVAGLYLLVGCPCCKGASCGAGDSCGDGACAEGKEAAAAACGACSAEPCACPVEEETMEAKEESVAEDQAADMDSSEGGEEAIAEGEAAEEESRM